MVKRGSLGKVLHSGETSTLHAHAVSFYARDEDVVAEVAAYVKGGLLDGHHVLVVATSAHRAALDGHLLAAGVDAWTERARGRLTCLDAATTLDSFMRDGRPDPHQFAQGVGGLIDVAGEDGSPVRVFGEMVALLWDGGNVSAALELEALWNTLADTRAFTLLCAYPTSVLDGGSLTDLSHVCRLHSTLQPPQPYAPSPVADGSLDPGAPRQRSAVFLPTAEAVAAARRFAATALADWGRTDLTTDVTLTVSELATNAVRHARSPFLVFVHHNPGDLLLVAVKDVDPDPPVPDTPTSTTPYGRGLLIVDTLSQRWGFDRLPEGKMVWAEFATAT